MGAAFGCPPTSMLAGGAELGARAAPDAGGARGPAGAGTVEVGVVSGRVFDALPASHISIVTAANPTRNAATQAPARSAR
ncbi:MAG TPA: hypothetical protein VFA62_02215 [Acidimicrobiia bacterium]|nr:hypothetical protein [Acidimicrobiia bacterium]